MRNRTFVLFPFCHTASARNSVTSTAISNNSFLKLSVSSGFGNTSFIYASDWFGYISSVPNGCDNYFLMIPCYIFLKQFDESSHRQREGFCKKGRKKSTSKVPAALLFTKLINPYPDCQRQIQRIDGTCMWYHHTLSNTQKAFVQTACLVSENQ